MVAGAFNRSKKFCKHGHPLSGANLVLKKRAVKRKNGRIATWTERCCRTCHKQWREDWRNKNEG